MEFHHFLGGLRPGRVQPEGCAHTPTRALETQNHRLKPALQTPQRSIGSTKFSAPCPFSGSPFVLSLIAFTGTPASSPSLPRPSACSSIPDPPPRMNSVVAPFIIRRTFIAGLMAAAAAK